MAYQDILYEKKDGSARITTSATPTSAALLAFVVLI
jgi:hypothetical protein